MRRRDRIGCVPRRDEAIPSRLEAGAWAAERYAEPEVLVAAMARQRGAPTDVAPEAAERFATFVERLSEPR